MAYDPEQRETEARKLEALNAISTAIATMGSGFAGLVKEHADQTRLLRVVDQKLDRLTDMVQALRPA